VASQLWASIQLELEGAGGVLVENDGGGVGEWRGGGSGSCRDCAPVYMGYIAYFAYFAYIAYIAYIAYCALIYRGRGKRWGGGGRRRRRFFGGPHLPHQLDRIDHQGPVEYLFGFLRIFLE